MTARDRSVALTLERYKAARERLIYADRSGADEAYSVLFDRRPGRSWDERIWQRTVEQERFTIGVWGM